MVWYHPDVGDIKTAGTIVSWLASQLRSWIIHLLNLNSSDLQRPVYRTFRMTHAVDLASHGRLVLVAPELWDDPYENLLYKHTARNLEPNSGLVMRWYGSDLFGSCWTWTSESDSSWRVYVPKGGDWRDR